MKKEFILATDNQGKIKEFQSYGSQNIVFIPQKEFGITSAVETGTTFVENAILKARHASQLGNMPAISDDSGLIVNALNGKPGIYSSSYANSKKDQDNYQKLLHDLNGYQNRKAHFYCVIVVLANHLDPKPFIFQGIWFGKIAYSPKGRLGFGYDSIFYPDDCIGKTAAQLSVSDKNKFSHRAKALNELFQHLNELD